MKSVATTIALGLVAIVAWLAGAWTIILPDMSEVEWTPSFVIMLGTPVAMIAIASALVIWLQIIQRWMSASETQERKMATRITELERHVRRIDDLMQAEAAPRPTERAADTDAEGSEETNEEEPSEPPVIVIKSGSDGLPMPIILRALNLADSESDSEGLEAVQAAMHHGGGEMFNHVGNVLQSLAAIGILTDELVPDFAPPDIWRTHGYDRADRLAKSLGGFERESRYVPRVAALLAEDEKFRIVAEAMVIEIGQLLKNLVARANDQDIRTAVNSRSVRAYVLLGLAIQQM